MSQAFICRGLYTITDAVLIPDERLAIAVKQALLGGARLLQYRDKSADAGRRRAQAETLNALCQHYGASLIINDDVELAAEVGAAGAHIGQNDPSFATARARLGENAIIGVSCYNQLELALQAEQTGANYVAFGAFFPSPTKSTDIRASLALLREARTMLSIPIVAIGGVTPENAPPLLKAGADALAVISGVFAQPDIQSAAARYAALFA